MELLEREAELRTLRGALERARRGHGTAILIAGEAGIGKTSLLRTFIAEVAASTRIWFGGCDDLITPRPLGVFRDMVHAASGSDLAVPAERDLMIDLVREEVASSPDPCVMAIDDAHWADDASLDVVRHLGRRIGELGAVLCLSYRPDGLTVEHPLPRVLGALTGPEVRRIELRALSPETVDRLAIRSGIDPESLRTLTGGNPFLLTEILRSPSASVPGPVRDAMIGRLHALPQPSRALVELISQVPGGTDWAVTDALLDDVEGALEPAEEAGLVELVGATVRFRHELARRAVDESLSDSRRVALNRSLLHHLAAQDGELPQLIHHAARSADRSAIARYAPAEVEQAAAAGAHYDTERLAALALEHEELLEPPTTATLLGRAAYASYMLNRFTDAAAYADRSIETWERLERPEELGDALLVGSRMHTMTGEPAHAQELATRAVEVLEPLGAGRSLALAYSTMGNLDAIASRHADAERWTRRALEVADRLGIEDVAAHALNYLGVSRLGLGDDGGFQDLQRAIELATRAGHSEYLFRASMNLGATLIWAGRHPEALPHIELAANVARDGDIHYGVFHSVAQRCHVDLFTGAWDRAEADLRRLLQDESDPVGVLVLPLSLLGRLLIRRGSTEGQTLIDQAWRIATETEQGFRIANAGLARIEAAWHLAGPEHVAAVGNELLDLAAEPNTPYFEGEVRRYLRRAGVPTAPFERCPPALAAGIAGDWHTAADLWAEMGAGFHRALELIESNDEDIAVEGLVMLDELGAAGTAARVRRELRRHGWRGLPRGPRPATRVNPAGLTPRQLDVLTHLAAGKTSPEIGDVLYVSARTVDNHVAAIMRKLGVHTRQEAVAVALARGLVEPGPSR